MQSFLCRIMALVFLVNCVTPTTGWGQPARQTDLDRQVTRRVHKAAQKAPKRPADLFAQAWGSITEAQKPQRQFSKEDWEALKNQQARYAQMPKDTISYGAEYQQNLARAFQQLKDKNQLASDVANNKVDLADLMNFMDPQTADVNLQTVAYAAEVVANTIYGYTNSTLTEQEETALEVLLPLVEAHVVHRLQVMQAPAATSFYTNNTPHSTAAFSGAAKTLQHIEAIGGLRMALLRIGQYYSSRKKADPAEDFIVVKTWEKAHSPQSQKAREQLAKSQEQQVQMQRFMQKRGIPDPTVQRTDATMVNRPVIPQVIKRQTPRKLNMPRQREQHEPYLAQQPKQQHSPQTKAVATDATQPPAPVATGISKKRNLAGFAEDFLLELRFLKETNPQPGSADYQKLQILAEYATAYTLAYHPAKVENIVRLFDMGAQKAADGVSILPGEYKHPYAPILNAIMVTVFEHTRYSAMNSAQTQQVLALLNKFADRSKFSLSTRIFALEAASLLYRPFRDETLLAPQDRVNNQFNLLQNYLRGGNHPAGLSFDNKFFPINMSQPNPNLRHSMALQVAGLYCSLQNIPGKKYETYGLSAQEMQKLSDKLAYMYDGFYDISTPSVHAPGQNPHQDYSSCGIRMRNPVNKAQANREQNEEIFFFTLEAILWASIVADGLGLIGTAFRLSRGAVAAMPRAATLAEIQDGSRFANWVYKGIKQQGYRVEYKVQVKAARTEKVTKIGADGTVKTVEQEIPAVTEYRPINHTYQLKGQYSHWNPKRYTKGPSRNDKIVGMRVTETKPGQMPRVAEATFEEPIDGLHSIQEVSQAWRQLRLPDGSALYYEQAPYFQGMLNMRQVYTEQALLGSLENSLSKTMDTWMQYMNANGKMQWWNISQWGRPAGIELAPQTSLFIAPKTARFTPTVSSGLMRANELADIPSVLPGFYTTAGQILDGTVHRQAFQTFFKPVKHTNLAGKLLLPDYIPTATLWKTVQVNPVVGAKLLPQMFLRSRVLWSTVALGGFMGVDYAAYYPFRSWMNREAQKDVQQESNKYGDTFSPQQAKQDEQRAQQAGLPDATLSMTTFKEMNASQPQKKGGTLFVGPIIMARRYLGQIPGLEPIGIHFVDEGLKTNYAHQAFRVNLNRDLLQRQQIRAAQQAKLDQEQFVQDITRDEQELLAMNQVLLEQDPGLQNQIHQVYKGYEQAWMKATTLQEKEETGKQFIKEINAVLLPARTKFEVAQRRLLHENLAQDEANIHQIYAEVFAAHPELEQKVHRIYQTYEQQWWNAGADPAKQELANQQFDDSFYALIDPDYSLRTQQVINEHQYSLSIMRSLLQWKYGQLSAQIEEELEETYTTSQEASIALLKETNYKIRQQKQQEILAKRQERLLEVQNQLKTLQMEQKEQPLLNTAEPEYGTQWYTPEHAE